MSRILTALVACVLAAALAACASSDAADSGAATSVVPPDPAEAEFRVLLVGDSVMRNLAPGVQAALSGDGRVATQFTLQTTISGEDSFAFLWQRLHEEFAPDVVIMLVGYWERSSPWFEDPNLRATEYGPRYLDPLAESITRDDSRLLWVGMPDMRSPEFSADFDVLNAMLAEQANAEPDIDYLAGGTYLNDPDGTFAEFLPDESGTIERVRRAQENGLHLCPAGVVRLARPILEWIGQHYPVELAEGWEDASWRRPPELEDPQECPPG